MGRNPRVIVIGQELEGRAEIQKTLALAGFAVLGEAGYGIEAVSLAKASEPDVVVISIEEPLIRALQTVEAIADLLPQSPIVSYSSIRDPNSMRKAMLAGVKDYLTVPLKEDEIINSIHTVMAQEERRRARLAAIQPAKARNARHSRGARKRIAAHSHTASWRRIASR